MGEGLVDFLFILFVAVAAIVQGAAAKRKKQQRQEAEQQRAQGQSGLEEMEEPADIFTQLARADAEREAGEPTTGEADSVEDGASPVASGRVARPAFSSGRSPEGPPQL